MRTSRLITLLLTFCNSYVTPNKHTLVPKTNRNGSRVTFIVEVHKRNKFSTTLETTTTLPYLYHSNNG